MKSLISSIFIIAMLFSSCGNDNSQLYLKYIRQFHESIKLLDQSNSDIYNEFELSMARHQPRTEYHNNYVQKVKNDKDNIICFIDSLQSAVDSSIIKNILDSNILETVELNQKIQLNKSDIETLKSKLSTFKNLIISKIEDKKKYSVFVNTINDVLSIDKLDSINTFNSNSVNLLEFVACLSKLKLDIAVAENDILNYLNVKISVCYIPFSKIEAITVPNSQILPVGVSYRAEIYFGATHSTQQAIYEIDGKKHKVIENKGFYSHKVTEKPGKYTKDGNFFVKSFSTGEDKKIPFKIEYEVLEKK